MKNKEKLDWERLGGQDDMISKFMSWMKKKERKICDSCKKKHKFCYYDEQNMIFLCQRCLKQLKGGRESNE